MLWPLTCLENENRLADKLREVKKLTPEYYKTALLSIDDDRQLAEFINKNENKEFLKTLGQEMRVKGEGLLKFEFLLLKERMKNLIVGDYLETEITSL